jgi:hypothetical protein
MLPLPPPSFSVPSYKKKDVAEPVLYLLNRNRKPFLAPLALEEVCRFGVAGSELGALDLAV